MTKSLDDLSRDELLQTLQHKKDSNRPVDVRVDGVRLAPKNPVARFFYFSFLTVAAVFWLWVFAGMAS